MFLQVLWLSLIYFIFLSTKSGGAPPFSKLLPSLKRHLSEATPGIIQTSRCLPPNDPTAKMIFQISTLFSVLPILYVILFFLEISSMLSHPCFLNTFILFYIYFGSSALLFLSSGLQDLLDFTVYCPRYRSFINILNILCLFLGCKWW